MKIRSDFRTSLLLLIGVFLFSIITGCDQTGNKKEAVKEYYDLAGFIQKQVILLDETKPEIQKQVSLNGKEEKHVSKEIDWKKELEIFAQADINKPAYKQSYSVKKDSLNLEYTLKPGENLLVRKLIIRLDSVSRSPVLIEGDLQSSNKLYESHRKIHMVCARGMIVSYSIEGYQKLALMDARPFTVNVKIGSY